MQHQQALQQQYLMLQQQQQALSQQQKNSAVQQPFSSHTEAIHQPYSNLQGLQQPSVTNLQQPYNNPQHSYPSLQPAYPAPQAYYEPSYTGLHQPLGNLQVLQQPHLGSPQPYNLPLDEPQPSASALGGQFQAYQPSIYQEYDDIGNEQVR